MYLLVTAKPRETCDLAESSEVAEVVDSASMMTKARNGISGISKVRPGQPAGPGCAGHCGNCAGLPAGIRRAAVDRSRRKASALRGTSPRLPVCAFALGNRF
jgi:hypothetical protein